MRFLALFLLCFGACALDREPVRSDGGDEDAGVEVSAAALQTPVGFSKRNSNACAALDTPDPGVCQSDSCSVYKAQRALAKTRHPSSGCNGWTCAAGNVSGSCVYSQNTAEKLFLDGCFQRSTIPPSLQCDFGSRSGSLRIREGYVLVTKVGAGFFFADGGRLEPNYQGDIVWYSAP